MPQCTNAFEAVAQKNSRLFQPAVPIVAIIFFKKAVA
jgi:hypothetical protein